MLRAVNADLLSAEPAGFLIYRVLKLMALGYQGASMQSQDCPVLCLLPYVATTTIVQALGYSRMLGYSMSGSQQKLCLACCSMLLVLAFTVALYITGSQHAVATLSVLRLRTKLSQASDISANIKYEPDQPPMPMTSTLRAQLAGHVHTIPWVSKTELNTNTQANGGNQSIPQHVYVSVIERDFTVSHSIANCMELNPEFHFHVMDDADIQKFVQEKAPVLLPIFSQLKGVERLDFWRYLVLWSQAGYYIDSDINCIKPFNAWGKAFCHQAKAVVGIESIDAGSNRNKLGFCCPVQYSNWAMAATAGHLLFEHVIDIILDFHAVAAMDGSSSVARHLDHIDYKTGPGALSRATEHYLALFDKYSLDVATHKHAELVGDVGVFPMIAIGSPADSAVYSQVCVKHMFAGSWKDKN